MKNRIVIIGSEGTARNIIEQLQDAIVNHGYPAELAGIVVDIYKKGTVISGSKVLGGTGYISELLDDESLRFIFALYKPEKMKERYELLMSYGIPPERFVNFIHPLSYVAGSVKMGRGNVLMSNSSLQSGVILGDFNIINTGITVEHEAHIGNGNFLAANCCIGSKVKVGNHCFVGLNSSVRENVRLGNNVFVGMHSLVLDDFDNCIVKGVPAG
jgi:sugar O-acyltransferase (sialic acid O-acetyltransferase NeuD family)